MDLDDLGQIAQAAGHGHTHLPIGQQPQPWYTMEDNVRPSYDVHFVQTFNPRVVSHLLARIRAAEDTLAEHGLTAPDPETHRIATQRKKTAK